MPSRGTEKIETAQPSFYVFPTIPTTIRPMEIQTVVANLVAVDCWFEFNRNDDGEYVIRVKAHDYPILTQIRESIPS
jgi:hypothetical protein